MDADNVLHAADEALQRQSGAVTVHRDVFEGLVTLARAPKNKWAAEITQLPPLEGELLEGAELNSHLRRQIEYEVEVGTKVTRLAIEDPTIEEVREVLALLDG